MTLYGEFLSDDHRRIHKWYQYFPAYERHFERFRNRYITLFEIGIGEGGSLQQWRRYLGPFVQVVGIDINPWCRQVEEDQIKVRIGSQSDNAFLAGVLAEFGEPDIVIDDGSHDQRHVSATFDALYPRIAKNGVYVIEDLHAAYFTNHGGGLHSQGSFIERLKLLVDEMHSEYTGGEQPRTRIGDRTTSVHFYDSIAVLEVGEYRVKGSRSTGNPNLWEGQWRPELYRGHDSDPLEPIRPHFVQSATENLENEAVPRALPDLQRDDTMLTSLPSHQTNPFRSLEQEVSSLRTKLAAATFEWRSRNRELERRNRELEEGIGSAQSALTAADEEAQGLQRRIQEVHEEIAMLHDSSSWRITEPLRRVAKLIKSSRSRRSSSIL